MKPSNLLCKKVPVTFAIHSHGAKVLTCSRANYALNDKSERRAFHKTFPHEPSGGRFILCRAMTWMIYKRLTFDL